MPRPLFILNVPPPYGGGELVNEGLYDKIKDRYSFLLRRKSSLYAKSNQGRLGFTNIIDGIELNNEGNSQNFKKKRAKREYSFTSPRTFQLFSRFNNNPVHFASRCEGHWRFTWDDLSFFKVETAETLCLVNSK